MRTITADFAICAAGPAGLAAAIAGAESGLKVAVFDRAATTGGTGNMGMGPFAVESDIQKKNLIGLTRDQAFAKFMEYTHWRVDARLVRKYIDRSADTISWLEDMGVEFYDSARYFHSSEATWHRVKPEHGVPGPRAASRMNAVMTDHARDLGVDFYLETTVNRIIMKNGAAVGFEAADKNGEKIVCNAKAVLVATGGFSANEQMISEYLHRTSGKDLFLAPIPGLMGDGIRMAWEAGAGKSDINFEMTYGMPHTKSEEPILARVFCQPNLMVNLDGERFINEEIMDNTTFTGNAINIQRGHCAFTILDSSIVRYYERKGLDVITLVYPHTEVSRFHERFMNSMNNGNPDLFYGETLEELCKSAGIDYDSLEQTIEEYNEACETGDIFFNKRREYMKPYKKGPYYAGKHYPTGYGTLGGIKINHNMEVLTEEGMKIPGLYAAGTDACNIYGDSYVFILPGNTMGFCINGGRMAGENAADYILNA